MLTVIACIVFEHNPIYLAFAVTILVIGAVTTMRLFSKVRRSKGKLKFLWLALSGMIAGGTVWSTHFVSMVAYESSFVLGYDLELTALSLVVAVLGGITGLALASATHRSLLIEVGGIVFGASIAAMHFIGIDAMKVSGVMTMSWPFVAVSIVLACVFGMLTTNRVARPVTLYCKYGAVLAFILAVASLHFVAMAGLDIVPLRMDLDTSDLISNKLVGVAVIFTMSVLLMSAVLTYSIDTMTTAANDSQVNHITHHDPLTGLPNRRGLDLHLENERLKVAADGARIAVFSINVSGFKRINEVLGQAGGDAMLRHIAQALSEKLSADEYVARIGGDEFVIVSKPIYYKGYIGDLGLRVQRFVAEPLTWQDKTVTARCSIGYTVYPDDARDAQKLIAAAQSAMHRARLEGGNIPLRYDADRDQRTRERSVLALDLTRALKNGEFELHYQLQNETRSREITGVEALIRWKHPVRGMVPPYEFIPIAEESNIIQDIGAWVILTACKEAASWNRPIKVAVNVAPVQLSDSAFPDVVAAALKKSGLDPSRLELEITETGIIGDTAHALQIILQLKKLGVRIAMDDFGTGYSSLATLQAFPFDKIKIDREFVKNLGENKQSTAIVKSTVILSESFGIPVLAEGVETEEQLALLASIGCNEVQGYLFGKPMPTAQLRKILAEEPAKTGCKLAADQQPTIEPGLRPLETALLSHRVA